MFTYVFIVLYIYIQNTYMHIYVHSLCLEYMLNGNTMIEISVARNLMFIKPSTYLMKG